MVSTRPRLGPRLSLAQKDQPSRPIRSRTRRSERPRFSEAEQLLATARPEIIAPWKIVEAVKAGLEESYEAGLSREQQVFDECMQSLATRNKIYLFFATRETSKIPELAGADRPLR